MSLTLLEARARAAALSDVAYDLELDLRDPASGRFGCRATIRFASTTAETFLELADAVDVTVELDGEPVDPAYDGARIPLTGLRDRHTVVVEARVPYVTDGDGMHLFTDPVDGETYASAYLGMDVSQRVFPCFDQVDLKAPFTVQVTADPAWTVLANGREVSSSDGVRRFATTPPIPPDQVVVCAGPWHSVRWEHAGLPFGWHARRSLAADLDRDADELRRTTEACFDHYATLFDEPYAFDSYDQVLAPGQNWGALETPGCVTYRDEMLPPGRITDQQTLQRAVVIAHEMAHMWFGNLVTMRWWEDTWLNESFADYMGYRVADAAAGYAGTLVTHESQRKPNAYDADLRRSTHPVAPLAEDVPDVARAFANFDAISYAKGNSALRQLVTWLGDETFLAGVNAHLTRHRLGNATLADFVTSLDEVSDRDVRGWVGVWLRRSGFDTLRVTDTDGVPTLVRDGERPHRLRLTGFRVGDDGRLTEAVSRTVDVEPDGAPVPLPELAGLVVVPNSHGETFARTVTDDASWAAVEAGLSSVDDDLVRAVLWATAFDRVRTGATSAEGYLDLVGRHLPAEPHVALVRAVLTRTLGVVVPQRVPADRAAAAAVLVAGACRAALDDGSRGELAIVLAEGLARTARDEVLLRGWLAADSTHTGVALDPRLRWQLLHRLAETGCDVDELVDEERRRDPSFAGTLGAATASAARPTSEAKERAWAAMSEPTVSNRVFEALAHGLWSAEQSQLLRPWVQRYVEDAPALAARRSASFARVVGHAVPALRLDDEQLALLTSALDGDLPTGLRRAWSDRLDDLRLP
ncbi:aminopeptidase N [Angustibacter aerolatus]